MEKDALFLGYMLVPMGGYDRSVLGRFAPNETYVNLTLYRSEQDALSAKNDVKFSIAQNLTVARVEIKTY